MDDNQSPEIEGQPEQTLEPITYMPAGLMAEGKLTTDGQGFVQIVAMAAPETENGQPVPMAVFIVPAQLAYQFGQILSRAGVQTEMAASEYRKQHARRLAHADRQAHGGLILPTHAVKGNGHA